MVPVNFESVRESLEELASRDIQERRWTASEGEVSSFVEAVEGLFDDSGLGLALERDQDTFDPRARALFTELDKSIAALDPYAPPADLINDERMGDVRRLAHDLLQLGGYTIAD